jgi:hypothetical protein
VKVLTRTHYFVAWLIFTLVGTVGGNFVAIFVTSAVLPFFQMSGASEDVTWWTQKLTHFAVALSISFIAFCYVVRRRLVEKADAEATQTI